MMKLICRSFLSAVIALTIQSAAGQVATGAPWMGSFGGGPDVVNLGNLNVNWTIPLVNKPGRGMPFVIAPNVDSSIWYPVSSGSTTTWQPISSFGWTGFPNGSGGTLTVQSQVLGPFPCGQYQNGTQPTFTQTTYQNYVYTTAQGIRHTFPGTETYIYTIYNGPCQSSPGTDSPTATATDSTGYTLFANLGGGKISTPNGIAIVLSGTQTTLEDINGNLIKWSNGGASATDTLNVTAATVTGNSSSPPMSITVPGVTNNYTVNYTTYSIKTNFGCQGVNEYGPISVSLPSSISLPDGRTWKFGYESSGTGTYTGRLASVTMPSDSTGPTITYTYSGGSNGINCSDGSTPTLSRQTPDGTWVYSRTLSGSEWTTTVTEPSVYGATDQTQIQFLTSGANFYEIGRQVFTGSVSSGTLLETTLICYQSSASGCRTSFSSAYSDSTGTPTTINSTSARTVTNQFPSNLGVSSGYIDQYNLEGQLTSHAIYDFGSTGSGTFASSPTQVHVINYYTLTDLVDTSTGASIANVSRVQQDYVASVGSGGTYTPISFLQNKFDETATTSSGAAGRSSGICPSGICALGNITSTYRWVSGGNPITSCSADNVPPTCMSGMAYLKSSNSYYDAGVVNVATDVNGTQTTFAYGAGSCNYAFPTSITTQTLSTSATWSCNGGVQLSSTDVNSVETDYSYAGDPFWRPQTVTNKYTNAVTSYAYPTSSNNYSSVTMTFNNSASTSSVVTSYDTLGRTTFQQTQQGPNSSNYDTVAIKYDSRGRKWSQTVPYSATLGASSSAATTYYGYDALDRLTSIYDGGGGNFVIAYSGNDVLMTLKPAPTGENYKKRNLEYNGAGWLTSVCEVVAGTKPAGGACGQASSYTGYLTKYGYDAAGRLISVQQNAQSGSTGIQSRGISYDGLGRTTSETIPEWSAGTGSGGSKTYTYDSDPSGLCSGGTSGDLMKTVDNAGNATCYTYDGLHRALSMQVASGPYANVTPGTRWVYDAATYNSTPMQNVKGSVAEAYTCTPGTCAAKLTDIYFSSSAITSGATAGGMLSQMWEMTPHSGGYFLTQDTYYPNGSLGSVSASFNSGSIGIPNLTYTLDGEGRPYSVTDGTNSIVSSTAYNAASLPTSITYGNAGTGSASDVDSFSYDPNTFRPTNLTYSVNPSSGAFNTTTALTWNPNGSLHQMVYTDGSPNAKSQTCNYTSDDLNRIASLNCGNTVWAQTFTYDPFGNITKSVPAGDTGINYKAAYSPVTNQVSSGVTASYDANGNQLTSTPATLTWNALNQPISVNSTSAY